MSKITRHDIAQAVLSMLQQQPISHVAPALAAYLVQERRTRELTALTRDLEVMHYQSDGVLEASVLSARELSAATRQLIKDLLPADKVQLHTELRSDVVGGVYVQALDKQLDLTIRTKLQHLKNLTTKAA